MRSAVTFLLLVSLPAIAQAVVVEMKRETEVSRNIIRLTDVAQVHDAVPEVRTEIEAVYVTLSPAPGQVKTVALRDVRRRLRAHGTNLGTVIFEGPVMTRVRRGAQRQNRRPAPPSGLTDLIARFVAGELGRDVDDVEVTPDALSGRRLQRLAARGATGGLSASVPPVRRTGGQAASGTWRFVVTAGRVPVRLGHNTLEVIAYEGAERRERVTVSAEVRVYCPVPVAARTIARRKRLTANDFRLERRLVSESGSAALTIADLVGRLAARAIAKGATIEPGMVVDVPLVRRGDVVSVIARSRHIKVKTLAQALEDGVRGQTIKVRHMNKRTVFAARVEAARTVVIELEQGGAKP